MVVTLVIHTLYIVIMLHTLFILYFETDMENYTVTPLYYDVTAPLSDDITTDNANIWWPALCGNFSVRYAFWVR